MTKEEQLFIKGFNNGYIIAKYDSQLMHKISTGFDSTKEFSRGLIAGKNQLEIENSERSLTELKKIRKKSHDLEKGLDRD